MPLRLAKSTSASAAIGSTKYPPPQRLGQWTCTRCLATQQQEQSPDIASTATSGSLTHDTFMAAPIILPLPSSATTTTTTATSTDTATATPPADSSIPPAFPRRPLASPDQIYDPSLPSTQRTFKLNPTDRLLKRALPHLIPTQYLAHSTTPLLPPAEQAHRAILRATQPQHKTVGVVVSAGRMHKTIKVRLPGRRWEPKIGKFFSKTKDELVHDGNESCVEGDLVELHKLRRAKQVQFVVAAILAPFGKPLEERTKVQTPDERLAGYKEQRIKKLARRDVRRRELREKGEEGVGEGSGGVEKVEMTREEKKARNEKRMAKRVQRIARKAEERAAMGGGEKAPIVGERTEQVADARVA